MCCRHAGVCPSQQQPLHVTFSSCSLFQCCIVVYVQVFAPPSKERLRHTLLHWLACRELGYTQLVDTLPGDQQHSSKEVEEVR